MADHQLIKNKSLALVLWSAEKEDDAHVYLGEIIHNGEDFYFVNEPQKWILALAKEKLDDLKEVTDDLKEVLLDADFCLNLTLASPPDSSKKDFTPTGMKWHQ